MSLVQIYQCLCDDTRLRILNLLASGDLCVCHLQEILGEPQVKISKHLAYLRKRGLVESHRQAHWVIYGLPARPSLELKANLACLQDCTRENPVFRRDAINRQRMADRIAKVGSTCCGPTSTKSKTRTSSSL